MEPIITPLSQPRYDVYNINSLTFRPWALSSKETHLFSCGWASRVEKAAAEQAVQDDLRDTTQISNFDIRLSIHAAVYEALQPVAITYDVVSAPLSPGRALPYQPQCLIDERPYEYAQSANERRLEQLLSPMMVRRVCSRQQTCAIAPRSRKPQPSK